MRMTHVLAASSSTADISITERCAGGGGGGSSSSSVFLDDRGTSDLALCPSSTTPARKPLHSSTSACTSSAIAKISFAFYTIRIWLVPIPAPAAFTSLASPPNCEDSSTMVGNANRPNTLPSTLHAACHKLAILSSSHFTNIATNRVRTKTCAETSIREYPAAGRLRHVRWYARSYRTLLTFHRSFHQGPPLLSPCYTAHRDSESSHRSSRTASSSIAPGSAPLHHAEAASTSQTSPTNM